MYITSKSILVINELKEHFDNMFCNKFTDKNRKIHCFDIKRRKVIQKKSVSELYIHYYLRSNFVYLSFSP